jgi:hypothetical protein
MMVATGPQIFSTKERTMTETLTAPAASTAIEGYFAMWNERDPARRRAIITATWTPDGSYIEPLMAVEGHEALDAGVAGMQAQFPGHSIRPLGDFETHHDRVRWRWELIGPDGGDALAAGTNIGVLAPDGRLRQVTGFFDHVEGLA